MTRSGTLLQQGRFLIGQEFKICDVRIVGSTIADIDSHLAPFPNDVVVPLNGLCVVPGLINSHDHLEFNLFSRVGEPPYANYVDWSSDIQAHYKAQIRQVQQIPLRLRLLWGAYKNIFSGVTTVVHHNPFYWQFRFGFPLEVYRPYTWIHSLRLEKRDLKKLITTNKSLCFIHLAEGTDQLANGELKELSALHGLNNLTVIIHGVGLSDSDLEEIVSVGCAIVWCPASNFYLFGKTAPIEKIIGKIPLVLGSDSTLTGSLSLFEEMRVAKEAKDLSSQNVLSLVTSSPAKLLNLCKGEITRGFKADLLIFEVKNDDPFRTILSLSAAKVSCLLKNGVPIYGDAEIANLMGRGPRNQSNLKIARFEKFVSGDFPRLLEQIKHFAPGLSLPNILLQ